MSPASLPKCVANVTPTYVMSQPSITRLSRVITRDRLRGTVRFVGEVRFASGQWAGVELDTPHGTCDGTVHGVVSMERRERAG